MECSYWCRWFVEFINLWIGKSETFWSASRISRLVGFGLNILKICCWAVGPTAIGYETHCRLVSLNAPLFSYPRSLRFVLSDLMRFGTFDPLLFPVATPVRLHIRVWIKVHMCLCVYFTPFVPPWSGLFLDAYELIEKKMELNFFFLRRWWLGSYMIIGLIRHGNVNGLWANRCSLWVSTIGVYFSGYRMAGDFDCWLDWARVFFSFSFCVQRICSPVFLFVLLMFLLDSMESMMSCLSYGEDINQMGT